MRFQSSIAAAAALLPLKATATSLTLNFQPSNILPNPSALPPTTRAVLTSYNETLSALITKSNTVHFAHVPAGSYLCEVYSRDHSLAPLRVDVRLTEDPEVGGGKEQQVQRGWEDGEIEVWQTFRGNQWDNKGERLGGGKGGCEVNVIATGARNFYEERKGFSPLSLLGNPMILLGIVGMGVMIGMPKLMENMDPEMREEFEKQQKSNPLAQGLNTGSVTGGFDMASWMAGSGQGAEKSTSPAPATGGKGKRRG